MRGGGVGDCGSRLDNGEDYNDMSANDPSDIIEEHERKGYTVVVTFPLRGTNNEVYWAARIRKKGEKALHQLSPKAFQTEAEALEDAKSWAERQIDLRVSN